MNRTINFNNQTCFMALEINNEPINDLLASEMPVIKAVVPTFTPQAAYWECNILAQFKCPLASCIRSVLVRYDVALVHRPRSALLQIILPWCGPPRLSSL
jgi:hypothetical protein